MRVMVTGGSGLLGHFVVEALLEQHEVTVIDLAPPGHDIAYQPVNVLDLEALQQHLPGHDAVIHLAAIDAGNPFPDETYFRTNVQGTWNLLHASLAAGIPQVVIASSSSVYGLDADTAPDYLPIDEAHAKRPGGVYGLSKVLIEETAVSFTRRGNMRVVCLRPAHIVRPQTEAPIALQVALDDGDTGVAEDLERRGDVEPYGALPVLRGYVRSRDAARAFVLGLDYDAAAFDAFNITAGDSMGQTATLARMHSVYGREIEVTADHPFEGNPGASVFDSRRARDVLGWTAAGGWSEMEHTYREPRAAIANGSKRWVPGPEGGERG